MRFGNSSNYFGLASNQQRVITPNAATGKAFHATVQLACGTRTTFVPRAALHRSQQCTRDLLQGHQRSGRDSRPFDFVQNLPWACRRASEARRPSATVSQQRSFVIKTHVNGTRHSKPAPPPAPPRHRPLEPGCAGGELHHRQRSLRTAFHRRRAHRHLQPLRRPRRRRRHERDHRLLRRGRLAFSASRRTLSLRPRRLRTPHGHSNRLDALARPSRRTRRQRQPICDLPRRVLPSRQRSRAPRRHSHVCW